MISIKPKYIHLVQKPECCAVTCFQMILYRNGYGLLDQEQLAKFFGVKINKKHSEMFNVKLEILTEYNLDEGISTLDSVEKVRDFFRKNGIKLDAHSKRLSEITDIKQFIIDNLQKGNDLWVEYKGHEIHRNDSMKGKYLHDGLVESIDLNENCVIIIDPDPTHKPRIEVKIKAFFDSLSEKHGKETGFLVISKKE